MGMTFPEPVKSSWKLNIVTKDTQEIVGGIGFLGDPDQDGKIEIGFATNESHRCKGYCFEAAQKLMEWALHHGANL